MEKKELSLVAAKALPALSGESLTYNAEMNMYVTPGYVSLSDNAYYRAARISDRLIICYHIGEGYAHTFLNGITISCWDGKQQRIIGQKFWGGSDWRCFSEYFAKEQCILMLKDYLAGQAKASGTQISEQQLLSISREMIEETQRKQLA